MVALRAAFVEAVARDEEPTRVRFGGETGRPLALARRYGRAVGGQRAGVPLRGGPPVTRIGALTVHGREAVTGWDGALHRDRFALYLDQVLGPTLRPGDVVGPDNLPVHHVAGMAECGAARGARLLSLPPCWPDFAPSGRPGATSDRPCAPPGPAPAWRWKPRWARPWLG